MCRMRWCRLSIWSIHLHTHRRTRTDALHIMCQLASDTALHHMLRPPEVRRMSLLRHKVPTFITIHWPPPHLPICHQIKLDQLVASGSKSVGLQAGEPHWEDWDLRVCVLFCLMLTGPCAGDTIHSKHLAVIREKMILLVESITPEAFYHRYVCRYTQQSCNQGLEATAAAFWLSHSHSHSCPFSPQTVAVVQIDYLCRSQAMT